MYRLANQVNRMTLVPNYSLPRINQAWATLQGKRFFSVFDFPNAYWQIEVAPECSRNAGMQKYSAFMITDGWYQRNRLPFGVAGAPATQQRLFGTLYIGWDEAD